MPVTVSLFPTAAAPGLLPPQFLGSTTTKTPLETMAMAPPPFVVPGVNNGAPNAAFTVTTVVTTVLFNEAVATIFITATETLQQTIKETVQETIQLPPPTQPAAIPPAPTPENPIQDAPVAATSPESTLSGEYRTQFPSAAPAMGAVVGDRIPPSQANTLVPSIPVVRDPANGEFPGGRPTKKIDLPVTVIFLLLFAAGAFIHITIYKKNAKRGHKFLLSDLMFDFCVIRVLTCVFRITWSVVETRGVILVALITENGGAVVLFAVNIFFTQRIVRSIQPFVGWHPVFSKGALFLLLSVPAVIILNVVSLIISFFSVGNSDRLAMTGKALLAGSSWIVWLSVVPLVFIAPALVAPGPPPEQFGIGPLRIKVGMVFFSSLVLATGAVIRLYTADNPERPGTSNPLFGRAVFYTTGFLLEIMVVYLYAFARIDLLFHVPNGSSGPGDYSKGSIAPEKDYSPEEIEKLIVGMGVPHQIKNREDQIEQGTVQAVFFTSTWKGGEEPKGAWMPARDPDDDYIPSRPERVTRRQTMLEAIRPQRPIRQSTYPLVLEPDNREYDTGTVEPQYDTSRAANQQYV